MFSKVACTRSGGLEPQNFSVQHYTLIGKRMLNKPLNPPFFTHAVMCMWRFK